MIVYEPYKSRPLHEFRDELQFEFPTLPIQLFDYYIVAAAIEMARKGHLIRRRAVIHPECGVTRYRLLSPDALDICGILRVSRVSECSCGQRDVPRTFVAPDNAQLCGRDICWYDTIEDVLHIDSCYASGEFWIDIAVAPQKGACELPDILYTELLPTLVMGARAKIMLITNRPWSNLRAGQTYYNEFLKDIQREAIRMSTHKQLGAVKMNFGKAL